MSDNEDDSEDTRTEEEKEYEYELMMDTAQRLEDLAMALTMYDDAIAKQALALAMGTLTAQYEDPCLHQLMDLATIQMEHVQQHMAEAHGKKDDDAGNN